MFNMVFLLLLGDDEHVEISGILIGLLKKKIKQKYL